MKEKKARGKTSGGRDRTNKILGVENPREIPWWYHVLEQGWLAVEVTDNVELMVAWKGKHPQLVG
jgi:hypothetical protein